MADIADIATDYIDRTISQGVENLTNQTNKDKKRLIDLENAGLPNRCRWCEEELSSYSISFCDRECRDDYDKYQHQEKVRGNYAG